MGWIADISSRQNAARFGHYHQLEYWEFSRPCKAKKSFLPLPVFKLENEIRFFLASNSTRRPDLFPVKWKDAIRHGLWSYLPLSLRWRAPNGNPRFLREHPSRFELGRLKPNWPTSPLTIRVHRNHSFEHVAEAANAWFAWQGYKPEFQYSDYDDSLSFASVTESTANLELVWLDLSHYTAKFAPTDLVNWLENRLAALRSLLKGADSGGGRRWRLTTLYATS